MNAREIATKPQGTGDTICAIATPPGVGGIGVVRISGPAARDIARAMCVRLPKPRCATFTPFRDAGGAIIDSGLALYFPAPHSFTGEDVLELQGHGGPVVLGELLQRVMQQGARAARPGEFSERAFLNGKLDLMQAEAIADLVAAGTTAAARAAQRSLAGEFSRRVTALERQLTQLRIFVEAAIDFPDEEVDFLADSDVLARLDAAIAGVDDLLAEARRGCLLRDGIVLAIVGRPNAGKSSLLNALAGQDRAIVASVPGTTRDVLREWIDLDGMPVHIADTAGLRETSDEVEMEGVRRARDALGQADLALLVIDLADDPAGQLGLLAEMPDPARVLVVFNKCDLLAAGAAPPTNTLRSCTVSARTGEGLGALRQAIREAVGGGGESEGTFSARARHLDALRRTRECLLAGRDQLVNGRAGDLLAEELRLARQALGELTGEFLPDDLLGAIFASFCIGK